MSDDVNRQFDLLPFNELVAQVRSCELCRDHLPLGPRPIIQLSESARILVVGQAPARKCTKPVCRSTIPVAIAYGSGWGLSVRFSTMTRVLRSCLWVSVFRARVSPGTCLRGLNALTPGGRPC